MMMKKIILIFILFSVFSSTLAQVKFEAKASSVNITTDDRVRISFTAQSSNNDVDNGQVIAPSFDGFRAMGPFVSQEFNYINGRSLYKKSHTYTLIPQKTGDLTIGSAKFSVNGKVYKTKPITIHVAKGTKPKSNNTKGQNGTSTTTQDAGKDILLVAQATNDNPYENEAIGLTYKLYIPDNYGVQNYQELSQPQYNGFWAQDIDKNISGPYNGTIKGKKYIYYVLKKKLLFPQQTGKLVIKPLSLSIDIQKPVIRQMGWVKFRDFEIQRVKLSSGKKVIQVKSLPEKDKPIDFTGAVGKFRFKVQADNNQVKTGNPVSVKISLSGIGNLKLFNLPKLKAPEGLEIYEPKHTEKVKSTFEGNTGYVSDEYIVIPNQAGKFIIPGMRFSYFNSKTKKYETLTTDDIVIFAKGQNGYTGNQSVSTPSSTNNTIGTDFRFIKGNPKFVTKEKIKFYKTKLFYFLLLLPFLLALIAFVYKKYLDNRVYDENEVKAKLRKGMAQKYLKEAKNTINDKQSFYMNLEKAIHNFLKSKLNIDTSELSKDNISKLLIDKQVDEKSVNEIIDLLSTCEMARYTPLESGKIIENLSQAENIINAIDKQIK